MWYKKVWAIAFTFYTKYCVNTICGIKSMDYSLYFLQHILRENAIGGQ